MAPAEPIEYLEAHRKRGEVVTGMLFLGEHLSEMHDMQVTTKTPLVDLPYERLVPVAEALRELQARMK